MPTPSGGGVHTLINDNINDISTSTNSTWSSSKINDSITNAKTELNQSIESSVNIAKTELSSDYNNKIKLAAPVNLLDNSNFLNPVNQRGQTSYTGVGYTIDRWRFWQSSCSLILTDSGITINGDDLNQYFDVGAFDTSKIYTAAACSSNGTIKMVSGVLSYGMWGDYVTFTVDGNNNPRFTLAAGSYKWAALYEGEYTADTLPEYKPKGYYAELLECQRYYIRWNEYERLGLAAGEGQHGQGFLFIPKMRVYPTVNFQNMYIGYNLLSVVAMEVFTMAPNTIGVNITTGSNFGSGLIYDMLPGVGGYCEFVADL